MEKKIVKITDWSSSEEAEKKVREMIYDEGSDSVKKGTLIIEFIED